MPPLEQWLRLIVLGSRVMDGVRLKKAALNIAVLLVIAVLVGVLLASLLVIGLYAAYQLLLQHGMGINAALCITAGIAALLALLFSLIGWYRFRRLTKKLSIPQGLAPKVGEMAEAFVRGLSTPRRPKDD